MFTEHAHIPPNTWKVDRQVMERAMQFYLERGIYTSAGHSSQGRVVEFLDKVHEYEVYLRDHDMFEA